MRGVFDDQVDEVQEPVKLKRDTELTLGSGTLLAISVPVPVQRYWGLEAKITRVLLEARAEALADLDPPAALG